MQIMVICVSKLKFYIYYFAFDMSLILRGISTALSDGLFLVLLGLYCYWCLPDPGQ